MEAMKCIRTRRSRRLFLDRKVPDSLVRKLVDCAVAAPSSRCCQPWHFIIVRDSEIKKKLSELKEEGNQCHIITAPVSIVVCVDTAKSPTRWIEDGVTATENLLLAAHALGLGSVYVTGFNQSDPKVAERIRRILGLPKNIMPITILPVGYPDPRERMEEKPPLDSGKVIHQEGW